MRDSLVLKELMEQHGFSFYFSPEGCEWYTKRIRFKRKEALLAITDEDGCGVPLSLDDPAYVAIIELESGEPLMEKRRIGSLADFLESLGGLTGSPG